MKIGIVPMSAKPFHAGHNSLIKFAAGIELLDSLEKQGFVRQENDIVNVYVSYSSRGVKKRTRTVTRDGIKEKEKYEEAIPGKAPVFGADMEYIWENILTKENLGYSGTNVEIISPKKSGTNSPVTAGFSLADLFNEAYKNKDSHWTDPVTGKTFVTDLTTITFYCGLDDMNRYNNDLMLSLYGDLWLNKRIQVLPIPRVVSISGTQMREFLCAGDIEALKKMFPDDLSDIHKEEIANILTQSVSCSYPSTRDRISQIKNEQLLRKYINLKLL
jgi:hypothetical protein